MHDPSDHRLDRPAAVRPGEELPVERLAACLRAHLPGWDGPLQVAQFPSGYSNLTYLVVAGDREYVLRRPPFGAQIKTAHDMGREYRILEALHPVWGRVPRPVWYCDDETVLGAPFYLMERVPGVILRATLPEAARPDAATMARVADAFVDTLVELHGLDYRAAGLGDWGRPQGYVQRQIEGWTKRYQAARTDDIAELERAARWLADHLPPEADATLIHNDYKYDNLVLDPDELTRVRAVLDWEMATIGDPLMDLGTTLGYWVTASDPDWLQGLALNPSLWPGNPSREALVQAYATRSGRDPGNAVFYYVYGVFKVAVIAQQIYKRYVEGKTSDARFAGLIHAVRGLGIAAMRAIQTGRIDA